jgi:hypothetical protein
MTKRIKPDVTIDSGIINLGKYTFPNMDALETNKLAVLLKHSEK